MGASAMIFRGVSLEDSSSFCSLPGFGSLSLLSFPAFFLFLDRTMYTIILKIQTETKRRNIPVTFFAHRPRDSWRKKLCQAPDVDGASPRAPNRQLSFKIGYATHLRRRTTGRGRYADSHTVALRHALEDGPPKCVTAAHHQSLPGTVF